MTASATRPGSDTSTLTSTRDRVPRVKMRTPIESVAEATECWTAFVTNSLTEVDPQPGLVVVGAEQVREAPSCDARCLGPNRQP